MGAVNNQIKKGLLLRLWVNKFLKPVNVWHSYKQERDLKSSRKSIIAFPKGLFRDFFGLHNTPLPSP